MDDRPKTIQEIRGMRAPEKDREKPYSAASYAAQYGITIDDAEELLARSNTHEQVHRQIMAMYTNDPELKRRAMMSDDLPTGGSGKPRATTDIDGLEGVGSIMADVAMLRPADPQPHHSIPKSQHEKLLELVDAVSADELQEWLDAQIQRGDHNLSDRDFFRWDDIPEEVQPGLRRFLALRMIEAKYAGSGGID